MEGDTLRQVVVVGDLHAHFWKAFASGHGAQNSRFLYTLDNLRRSLKRAEELGCPWLQAGDWVHTIGFTQNPVVTHLIEVLKEFPDLEKLCVWGNHDAKSGRTKIEADETVAQVLHEAGAVRLLNRQGWAAKNGLTIFGEGHQPNPVDLALAQTESSLNLGMFDVGLYHQTVSGSKLASGHTLDDGVPQSWFFDKYQLSIVGDIHQPQIFRREKRTILVPGSLEQHNFGDTGDHGFWVCTHAPSEWWDCVMVKATSPVFVTVDWPSEVKQDGNFYRILNACDPAELPPGVQVVSSPKTAVEERDIINPGASAKDILVAWAKVSPPKVQDNGDIIGEGLALLGAQGTSTLKAVMVDAVAIKDFMCYENVDFHVEMGVTLVTGSSRDFASNGAGKTSLFESIFWALFGRTTKGVDASEVIRRGADSCMVVVDLICRDGPDLRVVRSRKRDGTSSLEVFQVNEEKGWTGGVKELTSKLSQFLGLTPELYQALAYFSQSRLVLFSQASDSERKTMLADLCGLEIYQSASVAARSKQGELSQLYAQINSTISILERQLREWDESKRTALARSEGWEQQAKEEKADWLKQQEELQGKISRLEKRAVTFKTKLEECLRLRLQRVDPTPIANELKAEAEVALKSIQEEYAEWRKGIKFPSLEDLERRRRELASEAGTTRELDRRLSDQILSFNRGIDVLETEIKKLETAPDKCPACGQPVDTSKNVSRLEQRREELKKVWASREEPLNEIHRVKEALLQVESQVSQIDELMVSARALALKDSEYLQKVKIADDNLKVHVAAQVERRLAEIRQRLDLRYKHRRLLWEEKIRSELKNGAAQLAKADYVLRTLEKNPYIEILQDANKKYSQVEEEIQGEIEKREAAHRLGEIMKYWAEGFSRTGVQSLLMDEIAIAFNQLRSSVFPMLTRGIYDVQFATTSKTQEGSSRERTEFVVRDRGALVSYESLSGGQRRRVDLGVMLTLAMAVARTRQVPGVLGLLILDEVFGFLDEDGVDALFSVLGEVNRIIPSIYAVTHNPNLQSLFTNTLRVEQDRYGVSRLV